MEIKRILLIVMIWNCYCAQNIQCPKFLCAQKEKFPFVCAWKERHSGVLQYKFQSCEGSGKSICDWRYIHEEEGQCVEYLAASLYPGEYCLKNEECLSSKCENHHCKGNYEGEQCDDASECQPGLYCHENKCEPTIQTGKYCDASHSCGVTDICEQGTCVRLGSKKIGIKVEMAAACSSFYANEGFCQNGPTLSGKSTKCPNDGICNYKADNIILTESCVCAMKKSGEPVCLLGPGDVSMEPFISYLDTSLNTKCNLAKGPLCLYSEFDNMGAKFYSAYTVYEQRLRSSILEESEECVKNTINSLYTRSMAKLKGKDKSNSTAKYVFLAIAIVVVFFAVLVLFIWFFRKRSAASEESTSLDNGVETTTYS